MKINYISGNGFRDICSTEWSYDNIKMSNRNNFIFLNTEHVRPFFQSHTINFKYILVTNNSDINVGPEYAIYANDPNMVRWYAQNLNFEHYKVSGCPIGLVNYKNGNIITRCGDHSKLEKISFENNEKTNSLYIALTEHFGRKEILTKLELVNPPLVGFEDYLRNLSKSYFCLSPDGAGIDCHRTWEALYMKCIPIIIKNKMTNMYKGLPVIILNNWEDFKSLTLDKETYLKLWNDFDPSILTPEFFVPEFVKVN